jgi:polyhydroxyalkanoate synthase
MSSKAGLPRSSDASPKPALPASLLWPNLPPELAAELAKTDPPALSAALDRAILAAAGEYADGIAAYRGHPYRRGCEDDAIVWRLGSSALIHHGESRSRATPGRRVPALFVPSLLNRGWVLDLVPGEGMLSWLAENGVDPYRIEWGSPGDFERRFDIGLYVEERLAPAIDELRRLTGEKPVLVGYCMGGLLALAAALRRPDHVRGLALLATPWDFHASGAERSAALTTGYRAVRPLLETLGELPIDFIQALLAMHDPLVALRKFRRFAHMDPASPEARNFVALEDWLNDGVPLALPVADEALLGWYGDNATASGTWSVAGQAIDPGALAMPSLVVMPGGDRIVPPASAAALAGRLPGASLLNLDLGHIGMVVGRHGRDRLWAPLAAWIAQQAAPS